MEYYKEPRWREKKKFDNRNTVKRRTPDKKKSNISSLNPDLFIRKAGSYEKKEYISYRLINELPVHRGIISNLEKKGYISPTEIQDKTIEAILSGKNLMGLAQTGTGKTGAFLIPIIHNLLQRETLFQ
ncbi:MAG: DEAD/DEAH box helicase, partial [Bacteroidales bacterium]|nr:DEAD/DEAH box helicase [Bacteroidales bacterium]